MGDPLLLMKDVSKRFDNVVAADAVSLEVKGGELIALLGPSGSGKTTLLRLVAGFETPDSGEIYLAGTRISSPTFKLPPEKRNMAMVFQQFVLWPHMNVFQNIAYPLKARGMRRSRVSEKVQRTLVLVGLEGLGKRRPDQLSGGQKQRVALARSIALESKLLLMDEPLSSLDAKIKQVLKNEIVKIQKTLGVTALYVTHDQEEALGVADRILVINYGKVHQVGTPEELYFSPRTDFVAGFIGNTRVVKGTLLQYSNSSVEVDVAGRAFTFQPTQRVLANIKQRPEEPCSILIPVRPEDVTVVSKCEEHETGNTFEGEMVLATFQGAFYEVELKAKGLPPLMAHVPIRNFHDMDLHSGSKVRFVIRDNLPILIGTGKSL